MSSELQTKQIKNKTKHSLSLFLLKTHCYVIRDYYLNEQKKSNKIIANTLAKGKPNNKRVTAV